MKELATKIPSLVWIDWPVSSQDAVISLFSKQTGRCQRCFNYAMYAGQAELFLEWHSFPVNSSSVFAKMAVIVAFFIIQNPGSVS